MLGCWVWDFDFSLVVVFSEVLDVDFFFGSSRSSLRTALLLAVDSLRDCFVPDGDEKSLPDSSDVADDM